MASFFKYKELRHGSVGLMNFAARQLFTGCQAWEVDSRSTPQAASWDGLSRGSGTVRAS